MPFVFTAFPSNDTGKPLRGEALREFRRQLGRHNAEQSMLAFLDAYVAEGRDVPEAMRDQLLAWASAIGHDYGHIDGQHQQTIIELLRDQRQSHRTIRALVDVYGAAHSMRLRFRKANPSTDLFDKAHEAALEAARLNACEPE